MEQENTQDMDTQATTEPENLLFVDDEANILSSLKRLFRKQGYKIHTALSGADGLKVLEQEKIDLIISDMRMPEMDGAQFLECVEQRWPHIVRILLTGYADMTSTINAINKGKIFSYISKPWDDNDITVEVKRALDFKLLQEDRDRLLALSQKQNIELKELNTGLEAKVMARTEELRQAMAQLQLTHDSLKKSYFSSVKVFSSIIQMREGNVPGHSKRVAELASSLAKKMDLSQDDIQNVMVAGLLHGIGKMGFEDEILKKPYMLLNNDERARYRKYPVIGEAALMALEPLHEAAKIIRSHLEHYDGSGIPDHLTHDNIPIGARIIAVVNDYELLKTGMLAQAPASKNELRDYFWKNRGKRYDPQVVETFFTMLGSDVRRDKEQNLRLMSGGLQPGMVLGKDIITSEGVLLLAEGQVLDELIIDRIQRFEVSSDQDIVLYIKRQGKA